MWSISTNISSVITLSFLPFLATKKCRIYNQIEKPSYSFHSVMVTKELSILYLHFYIHFIVKGFKLNPSLSGF